MFRGTVGPVLGCLKWWFVTSMLPTDSAFQQHRMAMGRLALSDGEHPVSDINAFLRK